MLEQSKHHHLTKAQAIHEVEVLTLSVTLPLKPVMQAVFSAHPYTSDNQIRRPAITNRVISWLLMVPLVFFAVHGTFSFLIGGNNSFSGGAALSGLVPTRSFSFVGYVVLPALAYLVSVGVICFNVRRVFALALEMKLLTTLALLTMVSAIWSQDATRSLYNGVFYFLGTLFAYYLTIRFRPIELIQVVMMSGIVVCLLSLVVVELFPQYGVSTLELRTSGAWNGIFLDRTTAAKCYLYLLSPAIVFGYRTLRSTRLAYGLVLSVFILMTQAVTAVIVLFVYVTFMFVLHVSRKLERRAAISLGLAAIPIVLILVYFGVPFMAELLGLLGRDLTLSGRTKIWGALIPSITKHPLLGYGYYSFWLGLKGESANIILATHWVFGYAHNGLLEIILQLGFVGASIFTLTLWQAIKDAVYCVRHEHSLGVDWCTGLIVMTLVYNIDEATVVLPHDLLSILYIVACCTLSQTANHLSKELNLSE